MSTQPKPTHPPIFSSLKAFIDCEDTKQTNEITEKVINYGGKVWRTFANTTTHFIHTKGCKPAHLNKAQELTKVVSVSPNWIERCIEANKLLLPQEVGDDKEDIEEEGKKEEEKEEKGNKEEGEEEEVKQPVMGHTSSTLIFSGSSAEGTDSLASEDAFCLNNLSAFRPCLNNLSGFRPVDADELFPDKAKDIGSPDIFSSPPPFVNDKTYSFLEKSFMAENDKNEKQEKISEKKEDAKEGNGEESEEDQKSQKVTRKGWQGKSKEKKIESVAPAGKGKQTKKTEDKLEEAGKESERNSSKTRKSKERGKGEEEKKKEKEKEKEQEKEKEKKKEKEIPPTRGRKRKVANTKKDDQEKKGSEDEEAEVEVTSKKKTKLNTAEEDKKKDSTTRNNKKKLEKEEKQEKEGEKEEENGEREEAEKEKGNEKGRGKAAGKKNAKATKTAPKRSAQAKKKDDEETEGREENKEQEDKITKAPLKGILKNKNAIPNIKKDDEKTNNSGKGKESSSPKKGTKSTKKAQTKEEEEEKESIEDRKMKEENKEPSRQKGDTKEEKDSKKKEETKGIPTKEKGTPTKKRTRAEIDGIDESNISPSKRKVNPVKHILITKQSNEDRDEATSSLNKLTGWKMADDVGPNVTHIVLCGDFSGRTYKTFWGISRGLWILQSKWLTDSAEKGEWQEEDDYEVPEFPGAKLARLAGKQKDLLEGKTFFLGKKLALDTKKVQDLITAFGGKVSRSLGEDVNIVIADKSAVPEKVKKQPVVSIQWLTDSMVKYKQEKLKDYTI